jgi:dehydratase
MAVVLGVSSFVAMVASRPAPVAAATSTALACELTSSLSSSSSTQSLALSVTGAPSQSLPGATFTISIADQGETVPTTSLGNPVTTATSLRLALPVPVGSTFQSATLSGGSNVGTGATVAEVADASSPSGEDVVETVPGPIAAGQSFALPTIALTITASNTVGTVITTALLDVPPVGAATASADPVLSEVLNTTSGGTAVPVSDTCWPASSPVSPLSTTTVEAIDTLPPVITVTSPTNGAVYTVGQVVNAAYSCTDVASYGIATCTGTVASGSPIDTAAVGMHTFTVTATDLRGTPASDMVSYYVQAAPVTTVIGPVDAGAVPLASGTSCSFGGTGCAAPTPPEATYEITAPTANGGSLVMGDTFKVQWQVYKPGAYTATPSPGPTVTWTLPAPPGTVIEGPVTTSSTGLLSPTAGQGSLLGAGACTDSTCTTHSTPYGLELINGQGYSGNPYVPPSPITSITTVWNESSSPPAGTDGIYLDLSYTLKVTAPGTLTLGGFPAITAVGLSTVPVTVPPGVSFTGVDPNPPTITITTPVDGGRYTYGQSVAAAYTCADPVVTITSCTGTVADGAAIDTTSYQPGSIHTFTVTATDSVGNTDTAMVEYYVVATPPNTAPESYVVPAGASATLTVLAPDTATDYPIDPSSVVIVTPPKYGTATVNTDGTVVYTNTNLTSLIDSFQYTVADTVGNVSSPTTVSLTMQQPLDVATASTLPPGLILQQTTALPVDTLGAALSNATCSGYVIGLSGQPQLACGQISPVEVINDGGSNVGWTLTAQASDFLAPAAGTALTCDTPATYINICIPGGNLGWTPQATIDAPLTGSPAQVEAGPVIGPVLPAPPGTSESPPAGLNAAPQLLCQAPAYASEGSFTCSAALTLAVPASAAEPGTPGYQSTLTLTLS